ncbi:MAG TPA: glycosyltransferase family 4 protein [Cyclobacteriaceae bacterium]|nr:glycosyltransferase family 4 protein [Cyclobacteriaceae bacterium]
MLLNAPYPADMRIRKEAIALLAAGFRVHLLCLRRPKEPEHEVVEDIAITRIFAGTNDVELAFWDVVMSLQKPHPRFRRAISSWVMRHNIKILHVHDLPLVGTALHARTELNIPVISDFHENYPEALRAWFKWKKNPLARLKNTLFMNPARWVAIERAAVEKSDHVIAVVEEMKARLIDEYGAAPERITVVSNTEELEFLEQPLIRDIYAPLSGKFIVTYSGNIGPHRGVDTVIEAMQYLRNYPIALAIVGSGRSSVMDKLTRQTKDFGLDGQVHFFGRQPFEKFFSFMSLTDVNVIPHKSNPHTDNTVPHKLFEAMMVGRPVLVSSSAPLKRIVEETKAGVVFDAEDAKDCSEKILKLFHNPDLQRQLADNGVRATVHGSLNWETSQQALIALYRRILDVN